MTYQLMASLVAAAGSAVRSVRVTGMTDGIFYARVMLRGGATVDARPSDALNLAAITGAPVFVAGELLGVPAQPAPARVVTPPPGTRPPGGAERPVWPTRTFRFARWSPRAPGARGAVIRACPGCRKSAWAAMSRRPGPRRLARAGRAW